MSHFVVLVATPDESQDSLIEALQPYHEFECTGTHDQYVQWVPAKEPVAKLQADYEAVKDKYNYVSFREFLEKYHGYELKGIVDGEVQIGRYTNPDAKWDWWVVGGRWSGYLQGLNGEDLDVGRKSEIDMMSRLNELREEYNKLYDIAEEGKSQNLWKPYKELARIYTDDRDGREQAHEMYLKQTALQEFKEHMIKTSGLDEVGLMFTDFDDFLLDREEYVEKQAVGRITPFAFLDKEAGWNEKGRMGWFGAVADAKDASQWEKSFLTWWEQLPEDAFIWTVDCHI